MYSSDEETETRKRAREDEMYEADPSRWKRVRFVEPVLAKFPELTWNRFLRVE